MNNSIFTDYYVLNLCMQSMWRRQWQTTPVLLSGKSHGRGSLVGCSPWGRKESDTTERLHFPHFTPFILYHWRRKWQPTLILLPGKSHEWRSLVGYSPCGRRVGHDWATEDSATERASEDYITIYLAWGQFLLPENLLANPVILKCKLWE